MKVSRNSDYGWHLKGICMGLLAYTDHVTLICPGRQGLKKKMLEVCNHFAFNYHITFNTKKTMCIKLGEPVTKTENYF